MRALAKRQEKSLNQAVLDLLARALGLGEEAIRYRDLDDLAGTWREDPELDEAIADQHAIDEELWR